MGRTVAPYSLVIEQVLSRFDNFRRTLRREDREAFDELMRVAKMQVQAGVMAQHPNAFDSMSMAMLIHLKREINEVKQKQKNNGCFRECSPEAILLEEGIKYPSVNHEFPPDPPAA